MRERLRGGLPLLLVAGIAAAALLALVAVSALRGDDEGAVAWANVRVTDATCQIVEERSREATTCFRIQPDTYLLTFGRSLSGRIVVATRSTCCPGAISAELQGDNQVLVALPADTDYPVLLSVAVP